MQGVEWKLQKRDEEVISMHNSMTTMDVLSDCLIEKILSFLSFKEATQMSILSKTWLRASLTHPNLEFLVDPHSIKSVDTILERYRDEKIPIEKFKLSGMFGSTDKWIEIALQNGVENLVIKVGAVSLPIFTILATKSLRELVLGGYDPMPLWLLSSGIGVPKCFCFSLRKLSLCSRLYIDENMLQTLLNSCPLIVSFTFEYCSGLEEIKLLNLQKIKSVFISTRRDCPLKIRALTLEHLSYCRDSLDELDVIECQNLKSLNLSFLLTSDGFVQHLLSRFQFLEVLKIQYYDGIMEINSPNLVSFEYTGNKIPQLIIARESRKLKHSKFVLSCYDYLDDAWFCKLRNFLSNSISWSEVSLYFPKCNIDMKDLQRHHRIASLQVGVFVAIPQVDILNVDILRQNEECPVFVDALLRSCHPRRLNLHSSIEMITCFIRCLLIYKKNSSLSSSPQGSTPWHSQLIEIEAFDEKNQPLKLRSGWELAISALEGRKEVYFLLDW